MKKNSDRYLVVRSMSQFGIRRMFGKRGNRRRQHRGQGKIIGYSQSSRAASDHEGKKSTLKILVKGSASVEDFATNDFTKWLEEKTNVHIEWEVAPEKSANEKLNLVLSSGDYPDVIMGFGVSPTQMMIYGNQGVFLPLNDLIDKHGVEIQKNVQSEVVFL